MCVDVSHVLKGQQFMTFMVFLLFSFLMTGRYCCCTVHHPLHSYHGLLSFKKLSFPPPLWLSYTFSSFYFKHKTSRGDGTYAGIHTNSSCEEILNEGQRFRWREPTLPRLMYEQLRESMYNLSFFQNSTWNLHWTCSKKKKKKIKK